MTPDLDRVRNGLIERGLLARDGDGFRLTDAGNAHTIALIEELAETRIDEDFRGQAVRWNTSRSRRV